jgi:undecaprenyl-diphosphatase
MTSTAADTRRPLVLTSVRPFVSVAVIACAVLVLAGGVAFHDDTGPTRFDAAVVRRLYWHTGPTFAHATLALSDRRFTVALMVLVALAAVVVRRWDLAAVASIAPFAAVALTEYVLKPVVHRELTFQGVLGNNPEVRAGTYPSGHETALAALTTELTLLVLRAPISAAKRAIAIALLALWTVGGAVGLTRNLYHYATDSIGAIGVGVVCVAGAALLADVVSSRVARSPASTARAA